MAQLAYRVSVVIVVTTRGLRLVVSTLGHTATPTMGWLAKRAPQGALQTGRVHHSFVSLAPTAWYLRLARHSALQYVKRGSTRRARRHVQPAPVTARRLLLGPQTGHNACACQAPMVMLPTMPKRTVSPVLGGFLRWQAPSDPKSAFSASAGNSRQKKAMVGLQARVVWHAGAIRRRQRPAPGV